MPSLSVMHEADIPFAKSLTDAEGWGYLETDFARLIQLEPEGCFLARERGERVGIVTTTSYGDYGFLGSLIVRRDKRGQGIGRELLIKATAHLERKGVKTMELDGVFAAVPLYRELGFRDKYLSLRFVREPGSALQPTGGTPETIEPDELVRFDREKTGIIRDRVLRRFLNNFPLVPLRAYDGALAAYAFVRPRVGRSLAIGPFVSENAQAAQGILSAVTRGFSAYRLTVGVPEINRPAVEMLRELGFVYNEPSLRMYRGGRKGYEAHIWGILSPEKG